MGARWLCCLRPATLQRRPNKNNSVPAPESRVILLAHTRAGIESALNATLNYFVKPPACFSIISVIVMLSVNLSCSVPQAVQYSSASALRKFSLYSTISVIRPCASPTRPAIRHPAPDRRSRLCAGFYRQQRLTCVQSSLTNRFI
jgi:hypothetical protein